MKLALTVLRSNLIEHGLTDKPFQEFDVSKLPETAFAFHPREVVDDPENVVEASKYPQILGYAVLFCTHANGDKTFVTYERPAKATEGRLRGLASLGFGGHVEPEDEDTDALSTIKLGLQRELEEETGLCIDLDKIQFKYLINDLANPVGQVHVGLPVLIEIPERDMYLLEDSEEIDNLQFASAKGLHGYINDYEPWSQILIKELL